MTASIRSRAFAATAALMLFGFGTTACGGSDKPADTTSTTAHHSTTAKPGSGTTASVPATPSATPKPAKPMIPNPNGDGSWVECDASVCGGDDGGYWIPNPNGDGSYVPCEGTICTNPNHGAGTDPTDNGGAEMPNPNGDGSEVPCEGTICTNPNHGAGDPTAEPPEPGQTTFTEQG